jgi:PKD repeat protein
MGLEFGDGATSTEKNPLHVYEKPGVYTVSLTAKNIVSSQKKTKEDYIHVFEPVKPPLQTSQQTPPKEWSPWQSPSRTFQPMILKLVWVFGDGGRPLRGTRCIHTTIREPTREPDGQQPCRSIFKREAGVYPCKACGYPPVADFNANPTSGMVPLAVTFTDLSKNGPTAWKWTFGDGGSSAEQNPVYTYTVPGTYNVTLNCSNSAGSDEITKPEFIHAKPAVIPPVADFNANPTSGMVPLAVTFTDLSKNGPTAWNGPLVTEALQQSRPGIHLHGARDLQRHAELQQQCRFR